MKDKYGIYTITNKVNNKIYVGSTARSFRKRWWDHQSSLRTNTHSNIHLQRAWNKYGKEAFVFEILDTCVDKSHVISTEQWWMNMLNVYKVGYNRNPVAKNSKGIKRTEKQCKAQGLLDNWKKANKAWKGSKHTEATRAIIKEKRSRQIMKPISEETRKKLSLAKKSQKPTYGNLKYINIIATKQKEKLYFKTMMEAKKFFNLKYTGSIGRVLRKERNHWHGYTFTADEMTR